MSQTVVVFVEELHFEPLFSLTINADDMLAHWIITHNYIRTAFETKQILNPEAYIGKDLKNTAIQKFNCCIRLVNFIVGLLITAISVCYYFAKKWRSDLL